MKTEQVIDHISNWLKDYCTKNHQKGFVVGVSGGIDSAVTSALCARTRLPTLCVEMPVHQAASHVTRALEHVADLQKRHANVSLNAWTSHRLSTQWSLRCRTVTMTQRTN